MTKTPDIVASDRGLLCSEDGNSCGESIDSHPSKRRRAEAEGSMSPSTNEIQAENCSKKDADTYMNANDSEGPGLVTLGTYSLVCKLVECGTIDRCQVTGILDELLRSRKASKGNTSSSKPLNVQPSPSSTEPFSDAERHVQAEIYAGIQARLDALSQRIRTSGRASLPPSKAVMGPPFAPALDFLRGILRDIAAAGAPAGSAAPSAGGLGGAPPPAAPAGERAKQG